MAHVATKPDRHAAYEAAQQRVSADYRAKTPGSAALFERAREALPGGVSGNLRYFPPYPLYIERGDGCRMVDVDGNDYIDCFIGHGPSMLGHNHPAITAAVEAVRDKGSLPFNPPLMVECAELIKAIVPCAERVRFLNTGTEAVMTAVRCARAYTGRSKVVKFHGHYHGQHDGFLLGIGPTSELFSAGVPATATADTVVLPFNDVDAVQSALAADTDIAAVILDPAMHAGGLWGTTPEYLQELRQLTEQHGVVLIFDEVITGFRLALGGAQAYFGVTPDLATFAKALAAGEKLAALAGRADVLNVLDPTDAATVFQSGTVNDGTVALAAGIAALQTYRQLDRNGAYQRLNERGASFARQIEQTFEGHGVSCHVNQLGALLQLVVTEETPTFQNFFSIDRSALTVFFHALINAGVFLTVPTSDHVYLSFAHGDDDVTQVLQTIDGVFERYGLAETF